MLVGIAFVLAFIFGTTIGMFAAWRRGGGFDSVFVPVFMALGAFPAYFTALLVVYFLGLKLGWFPIQHAYGNDVTPGLQLDRSSGARSTTASCPALVIVLAFAGGWVLNMRTVMINTISEDYVAMAHAKGLKDRRVMTRYAARNAILPPLNGFAPQFATAVGGVIFVELVFSYPGAGYTLQQAALGKDLPLTQALLLFFAICPIVAIFIIDLVELRPRPAHPRLLAMAQIQVELQQPAPLTRSRRRRRSKRGVSSSRSGSSLLLKNPKSRSAWRSSRR